LVNKEELEYRHKFTDNDILAALVAINLRVDLAMFLTDVDGLYDGNPKTNSSVKLIKTVNKITASIKAMGKKETSAMGLGGMSSKINAAEKLLEHGITTIVANGKYKINDILEDRVNRTVFMP